MISAVSSAIPRRRTTLRGDVVSVMSTETPWVRIDAAISDGTGTLVLRFVGRRSVPGLRVGRRLVVDGTPGLGDGDPVMLNPVYSFISSLDDTE